MSIVQGGTVLSKVEGPLLDHDFSWSGKGFFNGKKVKRYERKTTN